MKRLGPPPRYGAAALCLTIILAAPQATADIGGTCGDADYTGALPSLPLVDGSTYSVTQGFGCLHNASCLGNGHSGTYNYSIDFNQAGTADAGDHVLATLPGTVVYARDDGYEAGGWGNAIILDHGAGVFSKYTHLETGSAQVALGQTVCTGLYIGRIGTTGNSTGPHLHFQFQSSDALSGQAIKFERFVETTGVPVCGGSYTSQNVERTSCCTTLASTTGETIIDNTSGCFAKVDWWGDQAVGYGGGSHWTNTWGGTATGDSGPNLGTPSSYATWTVNFGATDEYDVWVYVPAANATSEQAKYKIFSGGVGSFYKTIDQSAFSDAVSTSLCAHRGWHARKATRRMPSRSQRTRPG